MNYLLAAILRELDAAVVEYQVKGGGETSPVDVTSCNGQLGLRLSNYYSPTGNHSLQLVIEFAIDGAVDVCIIGGTDKSLVLTAEPTLAVLRESRVSGEALARLSNSGVWERILKTTACDVHQLIVCILSFAAFAQNRTEAPAV